MDSILPNTPQSKQCFKCKQWYPATSDYFTRHPQKKDGWNPSCKACKNGKPIVIKEPVPDGMKRCSKCKTLSPATTEYFSRDKSQKDGLLVTCKICVNAYLKTYNDAHKEEHQRYRDEHKEHIRESNKQRYTLHREEIRAAQKQYRDLHKDEINARIRQLRREDPVARERMREIKRQSNARNRGEIAKRRRKHYQANRDLVMRQQKKSYLRHRDKRLAYLKKYNQENMERLKIYRHNWYQSQKGKPEFQEKRKTYMASYYQSEHGKMVSRAKCHRRRALKMSAKGAYTAQDVNNQMKRQHGKCYYCHIKFGNGKRAYHVDHIVPLTRGGSNEPSNLVLACVSCNSSKHNKLLHEWERGGRLL